jgi:hypothetical protein
MEMVGHVSAPATPLNPVLLKLLASSRGHHPICHHRSQSRLQQIGKAEGLHLLMIASGNKSFGAAAGSGSAAFHASCRNRKFCSSPDA